MALRIAYGRIMQESNAFSPLPTTLEDFQRTHLHEGHDLARRVVDKHVHEVDGFARNAELSGFHEAVRRYGEGRIETLPLLSAWAISGGPLSAHCLSTLIERMVAALRRAGPVDGVFLALHGAMGAFDDETHHFGKDPEARILEAVREVVGPRVPIAVTFDLHGLLTVDKMAALDLLAAYHTNPHRDHQKTGLRAGRMLVETVLGRARPHRAWRSLPMLVGGGAGVDFLAPTAGLFRLIRKMEADPRVRDISLFLCHPWNDHPELGWSVAVFADDQDLAERLADQLAEGAWATRHDAPPTFLEASAAIARIKKEKLRRALGTICVCDASDVVGAGGAGENTNLLRAFLDAAPELLTYLPVRDPVAIAALAHHAIGDRVDVTIGGRIDPASNPAVRVMGRLVHRSTSDTFGTRLVIDLAPDPKQPRARDDGPRRYGMKVVLTEGAPLVMKPTFYRELGLDPWKADVCVVKSFFPFRIFFLPQSRLALYVKTRGVTDFDYVHQLETRGPTFPRVPLVDWRAEDRRRRAAS
jgi:microcystin degradation protein MlrC